MKSSFCYLPFGGGPRYFLVSPLSPSLVASYFSLVFSHAFARLFYILVAAFLYWPFSLPCETRITSLLVVLLIGAVAPVVFNVFVDGGVIDLHASLHPPHPPLVLHVLLTVVLCHVDLACIPFTLLPIHHPPLAFLSTCIGQPLAEVEVMLSLAAIVTRFRVLLVDRTPLAPVTDADLAIDFFAGATIRPARMARLRLLPREVTREPHASEVTREPRKAKTN